MTRQMARESQTLPTIGPELVASSQELDWFDYRVMLADRLDALGQLDCQALRAESSVLHELLVRGRELLGLDDPFADEVFEDSTPSVVLLRALARIARVRTQTDPGLRGSTSVRI